MNHTNYVWSAGKYWKENKGRNGARTRTMQLLMNKNNICFINYFIFTQSLEYIHSLHILLTSFYHCFPTYEVEEMKEEMNIKQEHGEEEK